MQKIKPEIGTKKKSVTIAGEKPKGPAKKNITITGDGPTETSGMDIELNLDAITKPSELTEKDEFKRISIPPHRMTPLRNNWEKIVTTIVQNLKLQVRMNTHKKCVELKTSKETTDKLNITRAADFIKAFCLGFDLNDSIALLRIDDLYMESFDITDVKRLHGDHLSRAIARVSGEKGKTKNAVENATRTRIVLADSKVHILGSYANLRSARDAVCNLILGSPAGKVYTNLRYISKRHKENF